MAGLGYKAWKTGEQLDQVQCPRCELYHEKKATECPNCAQMSDADVHALMERRDREADAHQRVGKYFLAAMVLLLVLIVAMNLQ